MIAQLLPTTARRSGLAVLLWFAGATSAGATLTLDEALRQALSTAPELVALDADAEAASRQAAAERWSRLPSVSGTIDVERGDHPVYVFGSLLAQERFSGNDFGRFDPGTGVLDLSTLNDPDPITNVRSAVTARMTLFSGGRIGARVRGAGERARAAQSVRLRRRAEVRARTEVLFRRAVVTDHGLDVLRGSLRVARDELTRLRRFVEEGLRVQSDVDQLRAHVADVEARVAAGRADSVEARSLLSVYMGLDVPVVGVLVDPPEPESTSVRASAPEGLSDRADVVAADAAWRAERAAVGEARAQFLPSVDVAASLEHNAEDGFDGGGAQWWVGAGLEWTFDPGQPSRSQASSARARAAEARRQLAIDLARHEVTAAHARSEAADARARAMATAADAADEAARLVRRRHSEGLATTLELTSALSASTQARLARLAADQERGIALTQLRLATGEIEHEEDMDE